jgi:hypothetical protein
MGRVCLAIREFAFRTGPVTRSMQSDDTQLWAEGLYLDWARAERDWFEKCEPKMTWLSNAGEHKKEIERLTNHSTKLETLLERLLERITPEPSRKPLKEPNLNFTDLDAENPLYPSEAE